MRPKFFTLLYKLMKENPNVYALTGDLGYVGFDKIRDEFPERFINCGASEFAMVGIAAGLALEGKIAFCYTITPFYYRAFEFIRTYINHEKIPVILVGSGRDDDYKHDGFSHDATDVPDIFSSLPNITQYYPTDATGMELSLDYIVTHREPAFLSLKR